MEPRNGRHCKPSPTTPLCRRRFFLPRVVLNLRAMRIPLLLLALFLPPLAVAADPPKSLPVLLAKVTKVTDGDSIEVMLDSGAARVRFSAIDTPEYDQPYGAASSAALKAMLPVGSPVELEV